MTKTIYPNIVRGGVAIPLNKRNYYYIKGRLHKDGGVDIGENPKTGLEVEGGEIVKMEQDGIKVFSAIPMLAGMSPAERVLRGENPDKVFAAQEKFKDVNNIKDDGTKAPFGTLKKLIFGTDFNNIKTSDGRNYNPAYIERAYSSLKKSGLTKKQQAVVLANIIEESGGDPFALNKKSGKDYGTLQWVDRYPKSNETDPYKEIDNQMGYFLNTVNNLDDQVSWTHGGKGSGYKSRKDAYNDFNSEDIETINRGFVLGHVRPSGKNQSAKNRLGVAEQIYDRIKRFGGDMKHKLIEVNIGGSSKLIRIPRHSSTGKSERSEDYNRKQAQYGIIEPLLTNARKKELDENLKFTTEDIIKNVAKSYQPVTLPTVKISVPQGKTPNNTKFKTWLKQNLNPKNNPSIYTDGIGLLGNIAGSLISHSINKKTLNNLKAPSAPVQEMAKKLKTKYNINPQEKAIKESLDEYERQVLGNTASSRVALARINRGRNSAINNLLNLYGQKENIETQLINQDTMNQQSVDARNIERINKHLSDVTNVNNKVSELKAENSVATTQNIISGISDLLTRREKRNQFNKTLSAQTLANPNLPAEMFREAGIWNEKMYNTYRKYNPLNQG